jgi:adhesin transport system membrane fusion protein
MTEQGSPNVVSINPSESAVESAAPVAPVPPPAPSFSLLKVLLLPFTLVIGAIRSFQDGVFARWVPSEQNGDFSWDNDLSRAYIEQQPLRVRALLYGLVLSLLALVIWAAWAEIDEVTRGESKVIPSRQVQIIQSQDGGVVQSIHIREGDIVEKGELLISLDQTRSESSLGESRAELLALRAKSQRLQAVADNKEFEPNEALTAAVPDIVSEELKLYSLNKQQLAASKATAQQQLNQRMEELTEIRARRDQLSRSLELTQRELTVTRPLAASGAVSEVELLRLQRDVNQISGDLAQAKSQLDRSQSAIAEARSKLNEVELAFFDDIREELTKTLARINALEQGNFGLTDRVDQAMVRSPVRGTIKLLYFNTVGGVVLPGKEIVEIVPLDDTLLLEAKIQPRDIAFLRPGQEAMVKFTAYDFVVYGGLAGTVERIGADTIIDQDGNAFYTVRVRTYETSLGDNKPIIPGMVAEVDILTGKKTILAYLMKPVLRAKQYALTEH